MSYANIIKRLKKAPGPSRNLDAHVHYELHPGPSVFDERCKVRPHVPKYTASFDAALKLLPEWITNRNLAEYIGHGCAHISKETSAWCFSWSDTRHTKTIQSFAGPVKQFTKGNLYGAATPGIAVCIAALKLAALKERSR